MATRKKKQTLAEFRAWLDGVEELQPETWSPDATQWKLIREKINNITESKPDAATHKLLQELLGSLGKGANTNFNGNPHHNNPYGGGNANLPPLPPPTGGVPAGPVDMTPAAAKQSPPPLKAAPELDLSSAPAPNMDTSDGNYNSGFS